MKLYDTQSRGLKEVNLNGSEVRMYCCGPTVYGPAHIGNFRTFVLQDVMRRTLETGGMRTLHVRNITDVDDKTIRDSQKAGKSLTEFTAGWTKKFHADCEKLGLLPPHIEPGAVAHIPQQVAMIEALVAKGHAYASEDGSVYFNIASFPEYGKLSRLDEREIELGRTQSQRANADEYEKQSVSDFVLWKSRRSEDGENFWASPWGEGRPGWHLECSAMIREYLGDSFDLHSGGVDLVFPHHENEIAQSRCACGGHFAHTWFHIAHLMVDGGKMSKSLGNLYTLADLAAKGYTPEEVRYVLTAAHYRAQLNFTFDSLDGARQALAKIARAERALAARAGQDAAPSYESLIGQDPGPFAPAWTALNHDLNTAETLGHVFTALKALKPDALTPPEALAAWRGLHLILAAFGIVLPQEKADEVPAEVRTVAEARWAARTAKDWAESDRLRGELDALGWTMKDGREDYTLTRK